MIQCCMGAQMKMVDGGDGIEDEDGVCVGSISRER